MIEREEEERENEGGGGGREKRREKGTCIYVYGIKTERKGRDDRGRKVHV